MRDVIRSLPGQGRPRPIPSNVAGMRGLGKNRRRQVLQYTFVPPTLIGTPADASVYADLDRLVTGTRRTSLRTRLYNNATTPGRTDLDRLVDDAERNGLGGLDSWLSSGKLNTLIGAAASVIPGGSAIANALLPQPQQQAQPQQQQQQQATAQAEKPTWIKGIPNRDVVMYGAIGGVGLLALLTVVFVAAKK